MFESDGDPESRPDTALSELPPASIIPPHTTVDAVLARRDVGRTSQPDFRLAIRCCDDLSVAGEEGSDGAVHRSCRRAVSSRPCPKAMPGARPRSDNRTAGGRQPWHDHAIRRGWHLADLAPESTVATYCHAGGRIGYGGRQGRIAANSRQINDSAIPPYSIGRAFACEMRPRVDSGARSVQSQRRQEPLLAFPT